MTTGTLSPLLAAGDYVLKVAPQSRVGAYTVRMLLVPPVDSFDLGVVGSAPLQVSAGVPGPGAGELETGVSQDKYVFTLSSAQNLVLSLTGNSTSKPWYLYQSDGTRVYPTPGTGNFLSLPAGGYYLVVGSAAGNNEAGT